MEDLRLQLQYRGDIEEELVRQRQALSAEKQRHVAALTTSQVESSSNGVDDYIVEWSGGAGAAATEARRCADDLLSRIE